MWRVLMWYRYAAREPVFCGVSLLLDGCSGDSDQRQMVFDFSTGIPLVTFREGMKILAIVVVVRMCARLRSIVMSGKSDAGQFCRSSSGTTGR
jgi:hypothetical protein